MVKGYNSPTTTKLLGDGGGGERHIPADADDERQLGLGLEVEVVAILSLAASMDQGAIGLAVLADVGLSLLEDEASLGHSSLVRPQGGRSEREREKEKDRVR